MARNKHVEAPLTEREQITMFGGAKVNGANI